jgi:AraC-like DNA-binding protein
VKNLKQGLRLAAFIRMLHMMAGIKGWVKLSGTPAANSFSDQEGLRMNDVYQFTMNHYAENIKLKQVADIAYMTPQAFCRYFKKRTGKNYIVFLNEIRISEACKKIIAGNFNSISSVAYDTGFSSAVSFNRVFKKIVAQSPREYQKEYLQKTE